MRRLWSLREPALAVLLLLATAAAWSAEKSWQTGTLREAKIERPKIVFGVVPNAPSTGAPRSTAAQTMERRLYVIETDTLRLEIRQDASVETPRIDNLPGESVTFAIEKNDIWIKDSTGREHRMRITKKQLKSKN